MTRAKAASADVLRATKRALSALEELGLLPEQDRELQSVVTLVTGDGKQIKGVTLNEDSFSVQVMDQDEKVYLLEKDKLRSFQKRRESLMPKYNPDVLSDKGLEDIVAYLVSVGTK